jgi:hypothetical protein
LIYQKPSVDCDETINHHNASHLAPWEKPTDKSRPNEADHCGSTKDRGCVKRRRRNRHGKNQEKLQQKIPGNRLEVSFLEQAAAGEEKEDIPEARTSLDPIFPTDVENVSFPGRRLEAAVPHLEQAVV